MMNQDIEEKARRKPLALDADDPGDLNRNDTYEDLAQASHRGGILHRINTAFHEMLQTSRGIERPGEITLETTEQPKVSADDLAIRRAKTVSPHHMIVPEGVIISGSLTSGAETEICGRVDGDVIVDGRLYLGATALISGNVRAASCKVEGLVEGRMECSQEIELGRTGRLNADAVAGKKISVAGQVFGNVATGGILRLVATGRIEGNIQARQLVIEEGSLFNGECAMRPPAKRNGK
jgi:cytoskeletal protein CcmA (bactofilin family)